MSVSVQSVSKRLLVPALLALLAGVALAGPAAAQTPSTSSSGQGLSPSAQADVREGRCEALPVQRYSMRTTP